MAIADISKIIQDGLGVLGGGRAQVQAIALSAKAGQVANQARTGVLRKLVEFGAKVGPNTGADFFKALAQGAEGTATPAVQEEQRRLFGYSTGDLKLYGIGAALLVCGYLLWRRK